MTNDNPHALVFVTHNWNPGGGLDGVYNDEEIGVWYSRNVGRWSIFNQDTGSDMPEGAVFNVLVIPRYKVFVPTAKR